MKNSSLFADDEHIVAIGRIDSEEVSANTTLQIFPRHTTVVGTQNQAVRADDVTTQRIGKRHTVQPLFQIAIDVHPVVAAIFRAQDRAAGTDRDTVRWI